MGLLNGPYFLSPRAGSRSHHLQNESMGQLTSPNDALVHVFHGVYERHLALAGTSVLEAKKRLPYKLPYFAHAVVNGEPVLVHHVLQGGDLLTFIRPPGFKGARGTLSAKVEARGLLSAYPELVEVANTIKQEAKEQKWDVDQTVDLMAAKVARWCEDHFGPLPRAVGATVNEVVKQLHALAERANRLSHGKQSKRLGRKSTTKDIADFAEARHGKKTWKEIAHEWNRKYPTRHVNEQKVREAWRRRHGDKAAPRRKLRGEG